MNLAQLIPAIASVAGSAFGMPWLGPVVGAGMQAGGMMGGHGGGGAANVNQTTQVGPGSHGPPPPFTIAPNQPPPDAGLGPVGPGGIPLGLLPLLLAKQGMSQPGMALGGLAGGMLGR